jgi:hypothetical protein
MLSGFRKTKDIQTSSTRAKFWPVQDRAPPEKEKRRSLGHVYVSVSMNLSGLNVYGSFHTTAVNKRNQYAAN